MVYKHNITPIIDLKETKKKTKKKKTNKKKNKNNSNEKLRKCYGLFELKYLCISFRFDSFLKGVKVFRAPEC